MLESAMPMSSRVLVPEVLPAVMPQLPAVPEFLPAATPALVLPSRIPADLPAEGREALAAALAGPLPGAQRRAPGTTVLPDDDESPLVWDDAELARLPGFLRSMSDRRDHRGRRLPLDYLTAVAVTAGAAGDDRPGGRRGMGRVRPGPDPVPARSAPRRRGPAAPPRCRHLLPGPRRPPPRAADR